MLNIMGINNSQFSSLISIMPVEIESPHRNASSMVMVLQATNRYIGTICFILTRYSFI